MSFLPYGKANSGMWLSSLGASTAAHGGIVALLLSTSIPFLPERIVQGEDEQELFVSLEILDASIINDLDPITEEALTEVDEAALLPETPDDELLEEIDPEEDLALPEEEIAPEDVEAEEFAALEPELQEPELAEPEVVEPEVLEPEAAEPEIVEPEVVEPEVAEPEVVEPEVIEPEPEEPEIVETEELIEEEEPEIVEPEVVEPEPEEPEIAEPEDVEPELEEPEIPETELAEPEIIEPEVEEPEIAAPLEIEPEAVEDDGLIVGDIAPDDGLINPLAEGGSGEGGIAPVILDEPDAPEPQVLEPEGDEVLAAITPQEPEAPAAITLPDEEEDAIDVALPQEDEDDAEDIDDESDESSDEVDEDSAEDGTEEGDETAEVEDTADGEGEEEGAEGGDEDATEDAIEEAPAAPVAPRIASPSAQAIALGGLIRQIRATPTPQCVALLPRRAGEDGLGVSMIGVDDVALGEVVDQIAARLPNEFVRSLEVIDSRQCAALDVVRQAESYPASRLGIALEASQLRSGDSLKARITGAGGLYITLLLVDDNGVVQDLSRFAALEDDAIVIDAPVARAGSSRATRQILFAIGTSGAPIDISSQTGEVAQDVFSILEAETMKSMVFGLTTFDVQ